MTSPFKFLEAYGKDDAAFFFGREKETAQLFNAVHASNLTLLYGASGTGKTSLINCGLANKFYDTDWLPLFVRRGKNLNESLGLKLDDALSATEADPTKWAIPGKINLLFLDYFKPVFLIFDQFEELYIFGDKTEQNLFYQTVKNLLDTEGLHVKIIISIREEWIAYLNEFEKVVPYLFDNRLRVERMNNDNLRRVIEGTLAHANIAIEDPDATCALILKNIYDRKTGIELTNLQVYLDRVYRIAAEKKPVVFTPSVVGQVGAMENVIADFLEEELAQIEEKLTQSRQIKNVKGLPLEVLFTLVSNDGTKKIASVQDIMDNLPENRQMRAEDIAFCLEEFKRIRIMRESA